MITGKFGRISVLALTLIGSQAVQADQAAPANEDVAEVVVTGSRIPQDNAHQLASLTSISSEDLESQGFRNVYDALNQQTQNTGFTQGADFGNTFTPAANANGAAIVTVKLMDNGGTANGGVDFTEHTFNITVTEVNDAPDAVNDTTSIPEDDATGVLVDVLGNDNAGPANESAQTLAITLGTLPASGRNRERVALYSG